MALSKLLILRRPRSGCLEGRTALLQANSNFLTASYAGGDITPIKAPRDRRMHRLSYN